MKNVIEMVKLALLCALFAWMGWIIFIRPAHPHDIYSGIRSPTGMLCCGGQDCSAAVYRERGGDFEFLTREQDWINIPQDRIQFIPIPGDPPSNDSHHGHLCYRQATDLDRHGVSAANIFGHIYLFCAFIQPCAI